MPSCGEALIGLLEQYGVDTVFGIPGVHTLQLYRGLANSRIRHIQTRHEQGAGFMADGYARVSRKPGVCIVITGPGVTNAATPLGQAWADSVPVLVISSTNDSATLGKGWGCLHEVTDQRAVTAPLTAFSAVAGCPDDVPDLVARAFTAFGSGRPRPVHISVPTDVLAMPVTAAWSPIPIAPRPVPAAASVEAAAARLAAARRPVLIIGGGGRDAGADLCTIAERLDAVVITTSAGKGIVPESHPLSVGSALQRDAGRDCVAEADVVLAIGTELAETDTYVDRLPLNGELIRADVDPRKIADRYPAAVALPGDAAATARMLAHALGNGLDARSAVGAERSEKYRQRVRNEVSDLERRHIRLLAILREATPAHAIVVADMCQLVYTAAFAWPTERPGTWLYPLGYCTLGCALPGAIGAKLAAPERPVMTLVGDGGLMFTVQELMVAVEHQLSLPVILWNNDGYGQIRDDMLRRGWGRVGVDPRNPDFVRLAESFGCRGVRPDSPASLAQCVGQAFTASGPTLIEIRQDADWI